MGSYHGGGSILKGGRFVSYDPADSGDRSLRQKKPDATKPSVKTSPSKSSKTTKVKKSRAAPTNPVKLRKTLENKRKGLLRSIIDQMLINRPEIKLPDQTHPDLKSEVASVGNPIEWAIKQADFERIQAKRIQLRKEREERRGATKKVHAEKPHVVIETKRPKVFHRPDGTPIVPPSVRLSVTDTVPDSFRKKPQSPKRKPQKQPLNDQAPKQPREDSTELTEAQIVARGNSRIFFHGKKRSGPNLDSLVRRVGILPPPPVTLPQKNKKSMVSRMTKAQKLWVSAMDATQRAAWDKLLTKHQKEYASFGKIYLGTPQEPTKPTRPKVAPLSDAPVDFIVDRLNKQSENDKLDLNDIDWSST